jgi:hypothetical protein
LRMLDSGLALACCSGLDWLDELLGCVQMDGTLGVPTELKSEHGSNLRISKKSGC